MAWPAHGDADSAPLPTRPGGLWSPPARPTEPRTSGFGPTVFDVAVNAVPVALCFLGVTALVFAAAPRATTAFGFGLVGTAFVWQIVGSAIDAPQWSLDLTPFAHVAPVPAQGMNVAAALVLAALGLAGCVAAVETAARRDPQEA